MFLVLFHEFLNVHILSESESVADAGTVSWKLFVHSGKSAFQALEFKSCG